MPRKAFICDLQEASVPGAFLGLTNVKPGEDDGTLTCSLGISENPEEDVNIEFMVTDISRYPDEHAFLIYTTSDDVPKYVTDLLGLAQRNMSRLKISDMLSQLSYTFQKKRKLETEPGDASDGDLAEALLCSEVEEALEELSGDGDEWSSIAEHPDVRTSFNAGDFGITEDESKKLVYALSSDLKETKLAGFRVGYLGHQETPIVSISCRLSKLGISEDAMKAWHVKKQQYLVCLIRYVRKYQALIDLIQEDQRIGRCSIEMRVGLCDAYKPSLKSALDAFDQDPAKGKTSETLEQEPSSRDDKITHCFISKPLNALLNERLVKIMRYRLNYGQTWSGAERFFNEYQGKIIDKAKPTDAAYREPDVPEAKAATFPNLLKADHLADRGTAGASFPLVAMQFTLRHFVRCTEFCLVCHCKTNDTFEAIKPYVCSKGLCLFQYMALGFGPSLEWEVISQPYVIDLLVSFTYSSAFWQRIAELPTGLEIAVPAGILATRSLKASGSSDGCFHALDDSVRYDADYNRSKNEIRLLKNFQQLRVGDWIAISTGEFHHHCRVVDLSRWPTLDLADPVSVKVKTSRSGRINRGTAPETERAKVSWYDDNFDDLSKHTQHVMIMALLDTLPSIIEMKDFLVNSKGGQHTLANWKDRISKPALDLLRWIVASNRSCIIQDDPDPTENDNDAMLPPSSDRVGGVTGYMQFRFAQGAPDKEERFSRAVMATKDTLKKRHETIFAWHGSPLYNWHGILREGLHFNEVQNGRAYGDGVYMSTFFSTSAHYIGSPSIASESIRSKEVWPNTKLGVSNAISLNEVVNSPGDFVSCSPHLVVSQVDWIQTRYLFVSCSLNKNIGSISTIPKGDNRPYYKQDPKFVAHGPHNKPIHIPLSAFSQQRRLALESDMSIATALKISSAITHVRKTISAEKAINSSASTQSSSKRLKIIDQDNSTPSKYLKDGIQLLDSTIGSLTTRLGNHNSDGASALAQDPSPMELDGYISEETDVDDLNIIIKADEINPQQTVHDASRASSPAPGEVRDKGKGRAQEDTDFIPGTLTSATLPVMAAPKYATPSATRSLQRDLRDALRIQDSETASSLGWYIDPNLINTVYQWIVELHSFDSSLPISKDMQAAQIQAIVLELRFPQQYPIAPPFVRVIRPRFLGFQQGGGGHVTAGGALCMELLTNSGWSAVCTIESVLLQVRLAISSLDPQPARLFPGQDASKGKIMEYNVKEAVHAYVRACNMHGWDIPVDFEQEAATGWVHTTLGN